MKTTANKKFKTVDEYLSALPISKKRVLKKLRNIIKEAAPAAEEMISYNMPGFKLNGVLVSYAAYNEHIGMYAITSALEKAFKKELAEYRFSKATIRFPLDKPLPLSLISKMIKVRVKENMERTKRKAMK